MKILLLGLFLIPLIVSGQTINGTVKDSTTGKPIDFATIYVSGTTHGTLSGKDGKFSLPFHDVIPPFQLVISHVSYTNKVIQISDVTDLNLNISLSPKVVEIHQVSVVEKGFRKFNVRHFENIFLGADSWGRNANLKNDSVLIFETEYFEGDTMKQRRTGKMKSFRVRSDVPLQIELPALGYDLQIDLIHFSEKYVSESNSYLISSLGYFYYKPRETYTKHQENRYDFNRLKAYYFSPMHFTRSLFENNLAENGYKVFTSNYSVGNRSFEKTRLNPDSCVTFTADSALVTGLNNRCFYVDYYCDGKGFPSQAESKKYIEIRYSDICFFSDTCIIRKDGTRPGSSIVFGPGLGSKRIGAMLPGNYQPASR